MTFGERVKTIRVEQGLTQTELAEKAGLTLQGIGQLERGRREPAWSTVQSIARALGVACTVFVDEDVADAPPAPAKKPRAKKGG